MVYSFESHNAVPRTPYTKSNFSSPQRESRWNDISWTKSYENLFTDTHCLKRTYNTWLIEFQYELIGIFEHRKSLLWGKWQILNAFVMITMIRRALIWIMTCLSKLPTNTEGHSGSRSPREADFSRKDGNWGPALPYSRQWPFRNQVPGYGETVERGVNTVKQHHIK